MITVLIFSVKRKKAKNHRRFVFVKMAPERMTFISNMIQYLLYDKKRPTPQSMPNLNRYRQIMNRLPVQPEYI